MGSFTPKRGSEYWIRKLWAPWISLKSRESIVCESIISESCISIPKSPISNVKYHEVLKPPEGRRVHKRRSALQR